MAAEYVPSPELIAEGMRTVGPIGLFVLCLAGMALYYGIRKGAKAPSEQVGIQALIADKMAMERAIESFKDMAQSNREVAKSNMELAGAVKRACDMMDLSAALKNLQVKIVPTPTVVNPAPIVEAGR